MAQSNLLTLGSVDASVWSSLQNSISDLDSKESIDLWAQTSLRKNAEKALAKMAKGNQFAENLNNYSQDPPNDGFNGFRAMFGLQLLIGYKIRFKATANLGYGKRYGDFGATSSLHFAAYNGGLGVGQGKKNFVVDITAAVNLTVGGGQGTPLQSYSLNNSSPIPNLNTFKNSFSYGQLVTWNSNINKNKFSLDALQREGMIGFRIGDVNISTNNDTKWYLGDGGDKAWTGGISVATPLFEVGFQDFSGDYLENARIEQEHKELRQKIEDVENDMGLTKNEKKSILEKLKTDLNTFLDLNKHTQTDYQKNLNKASTYFRINNDNGYNVTIDVITNAWFQNFIHRQINDLRFEYNQNKVEIWGGKSW